MFVTASLEHAVSMFVARLFVREIYVKFTSYLCTSPDRLRDFWCIFCLCFSFFFLIHTFSNFLL